MKKQTLKMSLLASAIICAMGGSSMSMAAYSAPGTLPGTDAGAASAIDVYHTSCFTWSAAGAAAQIPPESASATKRFVARVLHRCGTNNAACNPSAGGSSPASRLRVSIGSPNGNTPLAGATSVTSAPVNGGGILIDGAFVPALWGDGTSAGIWIQVSDNLGPDANGSYIFAVSHTPGQTSSYVVQFGCENVAVGALPAPDSSTNIITGTGVNTGANPNSWIDVPNNSSTTAADYNQIIDQ